MPEAPHHFRQIKGGHLSVAPDGVRELNEGGRIDVGRRQQDLRKRNWLAGRR
jgi:hypothetical protein